MSKQAILWAILLLFTVSSCGPKKQRNYHKLVEFKEETPALKKVKMAAHVVPTPQQLERQRMEFAALLTFGINTFTYKEWGKGDEYITQFQPINLDANQWVKSLKEAKFGLAILTVKHHDGFCLWPTKTNQYSVKFTPWKNGQGDVVKELQEACQKEGMKLGIYFSLWDRHAPSYGTPQYNDYLIEQLTELLSNYGDIFEIWLDGNSGENPDLVTQVYDWKRIIKTIRSLQPNTLISTMGDDIRWTDSKATQQREAEWSVTPLAPPTMAKADSINKKLNINCNSNDLGHRDLIQKSSMVRWYPAEMTIPIRSHWFYNPSPNNQLKSIAHLADIYARSVGNNSLLLLAIPITPDGLIAETDAQSLKVLTTYLQHLDNKNLVKTDSLSLKLDSNNVLNFQLKHESSINTLVVQEDIRQGQRVEQYTFEAWLNGTWKTIYEGSTIGYKKIIRLPKDLKTDQFRFICQQARDTVQLAHIGVFDLPPAPREKHFRSTNELSNYRWRMILPAEEGDNIIDNNVNTFWYGKGDIVIDLGREEIFQGFIYTPKIGLTDHVFNYSFAISEDNETWTTVIDHGEFGNIKNNPIIQTARFDKPVTARYVKFIVHQSANFKDTYAIAELGLVKQVGHELN